MGTPFPRVPAPLHPCTYLVPNFSIIKHVFHSLPDKTGVIPALCRFYRKCSNLIPTYWCSSFPHPYVLTRCLTVFSEIVIFLSQLPHRLLQMFNLTCFLIFAKFHFCGAVPWAKRQPIFTTRLSIRLNQCAIGTMKSRNSLSMLASSTWNTAVFLPLSKLSLTRNAKPKSVVCDFFRRTSEAIFAQSKTSHLQSSARKKAVLILLKILTFQSTHFERVR